MKFRNFLIVLLAILMAFVAVSCEDEPGDQVQPTPAAKDTIAKITVNKGIETSVWGNEKIQLEWNLGADSEGIQDGSVITLQFRTNRAPYEFDLRTNKKGVFLRDSEDTADKKQDVRWVYQESEDSLDSLSLGADGWYTLKYTFGEDAKSGTPDYDTYRYTNLGVQFKCLLMVGDVFEVKNVTLDGKALPLTDAINIGKHCSIEIGTDHDWTLPKTYVVVYALNGSWDGDDGTEAEVVAAGGKPTGIKAENGFTITYTDEDDELVVLSDLSIEEDTVINYTKVGDPRTVTFMNGEVQYDQKIVANGSSVAKPAADPEKDGGYQFAAWCSDSGLTTEFNFAETPITADTTLYAKFDKTWTVSFNMNGKAGTAPASLTIIDGQTATKPTDPKTSGFRFQNWKLSEAVFDFTAPITADIDLVADWQEAETVTFTYNLNYLGAPDASEIPTFVDEPATSTKPKDPERAGYAFLGWFEEAGCTNEYTFTEDVTAAKSLYAGWAQVYAQLTITTGMDNIQKSSNEKFQLNIDLRDTMGEDAGLQNGDVLTLKFRSSRNIYDYDIRTNKKTVPSQKIDIRWVYEGSGDMAHVVVSEPDADGWRTFTYTFGTTVERDRYTPSGSEVKRNTDPGYTGPDYANEQYYNLGLNFRGYLLAGDVLEIKDVALTRSDDTYDIVLKSSYKAADFFTYADVQEHDWTIAETHAVVYSADGAPKYNGTYHVEAVADGGYATGMSGSGYTYYSDSAKTAEFNIATTPITEDTIIYYTLAE